MKNNLYLNIVGAIAIATLVAGCSATSSDDKKAQLTKLKTDQANIAKQIKKLEAEIAKENPDAKVIKAKEVMTKTITPRPFNHYVQTQGIIESEENVLVSAKSPGIITQVYVREGEQVSKGQTLAQSDNSMIVRGIDELKSSLELANTVYNRQKNLWEQKIGTEVQYLQAKSNKESLERRLASLNEQNDMTRIKSPINGVVDEVQVKAGQNIAPGMPALRVVNNSDLRLNANVSEAYVSKLKKGDKVIVTLPDLNKDIEAKVTFVGRNINVLSRTFAMEADLPSSPELRPNMSAVIKVVYESYPSAITVPVNVVQDINGEKIVYVTEAKGDQTIARKRVVEVVGIFDDLAQLKGVQAGEEIITTGFQGLSDGQNIKVANKK
ncbi:MAG TPA: efflux RND transporter periplasmic adaptor subunit [Cyclobacteriaceae bacterium]